jgi:hypothetical protein
VAKKKQEEVEDQSEALDFADEPDESPAPTDNVALLRQELDSVRAELQAARDQLKAGAAPKPPPPPTVGDERLPLWRVMLDAKTPLARPVMEIHAADGHQAKLEYCRTNGISMVSRNAWRIEKVG